MNSPSDPAFIAFEGDRRIAAGDLREVARAAKQASTATGTSPC